MAAEVQARLSAAAGTTKADDLAKAEGLSLKGRHLEYADFSQSSLPNADLRRARLKVANFFRTKLEKANLEQAELPGAFLLGAQLTGADLSRAQLTGANLSWAQLTGANLSAAELTSANLSRAQLTGANLSRAQLTGASLYDAELTGADLSDAELTGASLYDAELTGADLSRAELTGANLSRAELTGTILVNIIFTPMNKEAANAKADKLYNALKNLPQYLEDSRQVALAEEKERFYNMITGFANFYKLAASEGCLAGESALKDLPPCKKIGDSEAQKNAYKIWARLACEDDTEKHWVARRMIWRLEDAHFPDFAPLLAAKLQAPDECPGLATLDDKSKKTLLDAAKKTP